MNLLIDTHIFLWLLFKPQKIAKRTIKLLESPENNVFLSDISLWEISLKYSIGKLSLDGVVPEQLAPLAETMGIQSLPLSTESASSFHKLPRLKHKDPFDRMLIWQAIEGKYSLVSNDGNFAEYEQFGLTLA
ncbi:MAG: PIN domain nuclease [Kangiella sp.]|nr:MAG: PIN domain nuclease [Kangiella sp.]